MSLLHIANICISEVYQARKVSELRELDALRYAELVEIIWCYLPGDVVSNLPERAGTSYFVLAPLNFYPPRACGQALIASPGMARIYTHMNSV